MSNVVNVDFITKVVEIEVNDNETESLAAMAAVNAAKRADEKVAVAIDEIDDFTDTKKAELQVYADNAANSATAASNSASSASTTATQLMAYLEDKETLTAPAVDPTLTISGAAADAKVTGDRFKEHYSFIPLSLNGRLTLKVLNGYWNTVLGHFVPQEGGTLKGTEKIAVVPGQRFKAANLGTGTYACYFLMYDSSENYIGKTDNFGLNGIVIPDGVVFVALNVTNASSLTEFSLIEDTLYATKSYADCVYPLLQKMQEDGYANNDVEIKDGVTTDNHLYYGNGDDIALSGWKYTTYNVEANSIYYVRGARATQASLYYMLDANNLVIKRGFVGTDTPQYVDDLVVVPSNVAKIIVNGHGTNAPHLAKKVFDFSPPEEQKPVATKTGATTYTIGTGKMQVDVDLSGSDNDTFNFSTIDYDGELFKACGDDITPTNPTLYGYIGANHGLNNICNATLAGHGLTTADIGKSCVVDGMTWVLLQVKSTSEFVVGCYDVSEETGIKPINNPPTSFNFGSPITVTSIARGQFYPSVRNISVQAIHNDSEKFVVAESYDIVNPKTGVQYIMNHIGSNDNNSVTDNGTAIITINNLYTFDANGNCVLTQNYKFINNTSLNFYGGVQSMPFSANDYFCVPQTSHDTLEVAGTEVQFSRADWNDESVPPMLYIQADNALGSATKMMALGVMMDGRNNELYDSAGFIYSSRKMYPYAVQPKSAKSPNTVYNFQTFRMPIKANEIDANVKFVNYCKIGSAYYLLAYATTSVSTDIKLPSELCGKKIEVLISKNATVINSIVSTTLDLVTTGEGYVFVKLTA